MGFLTTGDLARLLKLAPSTAHKWVVKMGREGVDYVWVGRRRGRGIILLRREFLQRLLPPGVTVEQLESGDYVALRGREFAALLGRSKSTAFRLARAGRVRCVVVKGKRPVYRFLVPREVIPLLKEATDVMQELLQPPQPLSPNK